MMRLRIQLTCLAVALLALLAAFPAAAQCDNGREGILSDTFLGGTAVEWRMLGEHRAVTLTVSAPCGLVVDRTYEKGESPVFDIREIPANNPDGVYTWQLRVAPHVDPKVEKILKQARESGNDATIEYELRQEGALPEGPFLQTGSFTVFKGSIVPPDEEERESSSKLTAGVRPAASADNCPHVPSAPAIRSARLGAIVPAVDGGGSTRTFAPAADGTMLRMAQDVGRVTGEQVISGDLTVYNSLCVGFDCATSETYGADTIRLKENNLRIHFEDTSAGTFPSRDWRIEINSQTNGGQSHFRINDVDGARSPFTIEAGAPSHSLYVDSTGRIGRRTANPVLDLHIVDGDTPGIRLQQDTSSGFGAQVWDIAGNETNFFVRDASSGSTLPFRIFPGSPSSSLVVRDGNVGVGTASPSDDLTIKSRAGNSDVLVVKNSTAANTTIFRVFETTSNDGLFSVFTGAGAEATRFTSVNGGRLALGCNVPQHTLDLGNTAGAACSASTSRSFIDAGSTTFTASSSRTIKENISPLVGENILEKIATIPVYRYDFIEGPKEKIGLMAEDFHRVFEQGSDQLLNGQEVDMALWLAVQELASSNARLGEDKEELVKQLHGFEETNRNLLERLTRLEAALAALNP